MHKKVEESSIQYPRRVDAAVSVRALQMCSDVCASVSFMLALYLRAVLISSPDT